MAQKLLRNLFVDSIGTKVAPSKEELASVRAHLKYWKVRVGGIEKVSLVPSDEPGEEKRTDIIVTGRLLGIHPKINAFELFAEVGSRPNSGDWVWDNA